ncbi:MAG: FISUMP domain-containing protein [Bacteroidota bacterium]|jgi:uncharacterized protein (TIGR02145 family)
MIRIFKQIGWLSVVLCILQTSYAQSPTGFNFQGLALTANGTPVLTKKISLRLTLLEASATGTARYQELHGVNTDAYGQFTVVVGSGQAVTGKFSDLQWSKVAYFLKSEIDIDGATNFVNVGTSQLMSVPYALYANTSGTASVNADSILSDLRAIKLIQKGDSILLNNNRGGVYIQKIDSLTAITKELARLKAQYDGTTDSILNLLNKKYDSLATTISNLNSAPTIPTTSNTASTLKYVSKGLDSVLMPSVYFDGVKTNIHIGAIKLGSLMIRNFTLEAWVKLYKNSDTSQTIIYSGIDGSGWVDFQLRILNKQIIFQTRNQSGIVISTDFPSDNLWHHVAVTNQDGKSCSIFIDGTEKIKQNNIGSGIASSPNVTIGASYNLDANVIQSSKNSAYQNFFNGNIRKLRVSKGIVYSTDFNPSSKYVKVDSTLALWELNEGTGTEIKSSDPSYNGILYNGAWQTNDVNTLNNVVDVDGNVYKTVKIGNQIWMAENLKTTSYRDGSKIPEIADATSWKNLTSGAFSYAYNLPTQDKIYGKLYNYYVIENTQKVCPVGWRIPSINDFNVLENYLGKDSAAHLLKSDAGWSGPSENNGNNKTGFNGLPGGGKDGVGGFTSIGGIGFFWTDTKFSDLTIQHIILVNSNRYIQKFISDKNSGYSIRCIKE